MLQHGMFEVYLSWFVFGGCVVGGTDGESPVVVSLR